MSTASASRLFKSISLLIFLAGSIQSMHGQITSVQMLGHFDEIYRVDSRLVSGDFYHDPSPKSTTGHRFFGEKEWESGSAVISGIRFDSILLRYDICSNKLVLNTSNLTRSLHQISLNKENVSSFSMGGKNFIPYPLQEPDKEISFCQVLASGRVSLLLQQSKNLKVPISGNTNFAYETASRLKLFIDGELTDYKGKRSLFRIYPQLKDQLQTYSRTSHLRLWGKRTEDHARLVNYCNTLLTPSE